MKLFFLNGRRQGQEIELRPPGISIGRETDNDVVLEEEGASRYHAKLEWRDTAWLVRDLGSTNGTKVNGERVQERLLKPGDHLRVGHQELLFGETRDASVPAPAPAAPAPAVAPAAPSAPAPAAAAAPAAPPSSQPTTAAPSPTQTRQEIPGGAKSFQEFFAKQGAGGASLSLFGGKVSPGAAAEEAAKRAHASPVFYVTVIGLAILVVGGFLLWDMMAAKRQKPATVPTVKKPTPLLVVYEKQEASNDNIYRFRLEIRDLVIRIEKDDLKNHIRLTRQKEIVEKQIENLEHDLRQTEFMGLKPVAPGVSADGRDRRRSLIVAYGRELNDVTVRNTFAPTSFEEVVALVEDFSRDVLNTPAGHLTAEEMLREGLNAFAKGEELYKNHEARPRNLRDAIARLAYAIELLENFEPKPREYELAFQYRREAETMIKDRIQQAINEAIRAKKLKDYAAARNAYRSIMEMTDAGDKHYEEARKWVIALEDQLRRRR